jgi:hypothetical protein
MLFHSLLPSWRMASSGTLCHVALVRTDVSEELIASIIRETRISELGTTLAVTSNRCMLVFLRSVRRLLVTASVVPSSPILATLMKEELGSSETSVLRATRCNIPEDTILHSHRRENLKSYKAHASSRCHVLLYKAIHHFLISTFIVHYNKCYECIKNAAKL